MALRIKKFDPSRISDGKILFLIGKRNTGKTILMNDLLYHMPRPDYAVGMSPTQDTLRLFRTFLPESCIFDHFSQDEIDKIVRVQAELSVRGKKRSVLIILDDCIYERGVLKTTSMRSIFFNGRHDNISLLCTAQYMMDMEPAARTNMDYIFLMRETAKNNKEKLYKHYFGQFDKFEKFDRVFNACTNNFKCLVLDNTVSSTDTLDGVKWFKANEHTPHFKLGRKVYWQWSKRYSISTEQMKRMHKEQTQQQQYEGTKSKVVVVHIEDDDEHNAPPTRSPQAVRDTERHEPRASRSYGVPSNSRVRHE
jgi:hypothetical protein